MVEGKASKPVAGAAGAESLRVLTQPLQLGKRGRGATPEPPRPTAEQPLAVARSLAVAHRLQARLDAGEFQSMAEVGRQFGFTRARVTQILRLLELAPDIQEEILFLRRRDGSLAEVDLRWVASPVLWPEQRARWRQLRAKRLNAQRGPDAPSEEPRQARST